uniref:C-type lectin domain-containing protein n=1 Tax=Romanomermis culicivorax TaxID=13658 RepID=A0A915KML0_ROMCU
MIIEAKSFMMRLSILVILNLLPLSCETGCPSGWADGSNSGFVGCFKYVGSTYATLPYAIRQCKLADARAHLPYLPEIRTLADMANFGNFTQSSFNTQELMWMGIAAFGPANPNASYDWYYPAANASRFIRTPFNLPWSSLVEFWTAIPVSNVSIQSHPIRSQKNTGHLHYGRW